MKYISVLTFLLISAGIAFSQSNDSLLRIQFNLMIKASLKSMNVARYEEAHALTNSAEKLVLDSMTLPSPLLGNCCFNRARIYRRKKDFDSAEIWFIKSKESWENTLGKYHPIYLNSIYQLGLMYREMHQYKKAVDAFLDLKQNLNESVSRKDSSYLECLNSLGLCYLDLEKFSKAELILTEAYDNLYDSSGRIHPLASNTLNNLALLYKKTAQFEKAVSSLKEVLKIREKSIGKRNLIYTISLGNLASLYKEIGNYENAEDYYLEAFNLRREIFGENHVYTLGSLENIAGLYREMGNKDKAIELYKQVNEGRKRLLGKMHSVYGIGLNHLANTYNEINKPNEAMLLYKELLNLRAHNLPTYQKEYVETMNKLTGIYLKLDSFDLAMGMNNFALLYCDSVFGRSNALYANSLSQRGLLEKQLGHCDEAQQHFLEASKIYKDIFGQDHYKYAESIEDLASLHLDLGNYKEAEPLFIESAKIKKQVLGRKHNLYIASLDQLGEFYELQKKYRSSDPLFREISDRDQEQLNMATGFLTERELESFTQSFIERSDKLGSYVILRSQQPNEQGYLSTYVLNNNLFYKGFLLTSAKQLNKQASITEEALKLNSELKNLRRLLGRSYISPLANSEEIKNLEERANQLEKELRKMISGYTEANESIRWQQIQQVLSEQEAALEFIHFKDISDTINHSIQYAAIIIKAGSKEPQFIPLFKESALISLLPSNSEFQSSIITNLYSSHRGSSKSLTKKKPDLYELIWQPLDSVLNDVKTIYYSPTGVLHRLNLNAIPVKAKTILADQFELINVNSTRQLAASTQIYSTNSTALLYGGIDYNQSIDQPSGPIQGQPVIENISVFQQNTDSGDEEAFSFLPGTEEEVDSICKTMQLAGLKVDIKKGKEATESYFKSICQDHSESPRVIFLGTHGYFFQSSANQNEIAKTTASKDSEPVFKTSSDPMFRSGLILAGGNVSWRGKQMEPGQDDGILTAYEISQLNLSNTELVVLSACETGLGDLRGSEGVYGLQRAFRIAGAKHLIMSLWEVPDGSTTRLMMEFTKNWLLENMTISTALYTAQKSLREMGFDPYQWAGFVLVE